MAGKETRMIIDCDRCQVRGDACRECVVGVFLDLPAATSAAAGQSHRPSGARTVQLDAPQCRALDVLADEGLVPRLRLVSGEPGPVSPTSRLEDGMSNAG